MNYIKAYQVALPHLRIGGKLLHPRRGRDIQHAVCYTDEDIITLAYAAASEICEGVDAVLFATTTPVFQRRYHASYLADLLELPTGITALDLGTTNRSGTDALLLADLLVGSGRHHNVLVVAAEVSFPPIGRETETPFGHGAVAMVVSADEGLAQIAHTATFSEALAEDFVYKGEPVIYDARFAQTAGFLRNMQTVLQTISPGDVQHLVVNSAYVKRLLGQLKKTGFDLEKQLVPDKLVPRVGYLGAAHGLLRLVWAMENSPGLSVLVDYNNGSNVIALRVPQTTTPQLDERPTTAISSYQDYLTLRRQGKFDEPDYRRLEVFSSEMIQEREKDQLWHLKGFRCQHCGTVYFLKAARCHHCKSDAWSEQRLSRTGTVYSLTNEYYFPNSFPPTNMIVVDLDGGGRMTVQQTDDLYPGGAVGLQIGDRVRLVLRKIMENDRRPNYFWKCVKA